MGDKHFAETVTGVKRGEIRADTMNLWKNVQRERMQQQVAVEREGVQEKDSAGRTPSPSPSSSESPESPSSSSSSPAKKETPPYSGPHDDPMKG